MRIIIVCIFFYLNASCQQRSSHSEKESVDSFKVYVDNYIGIILDVRTPEENNEEHIQGAINIDYNNDGFSSALDTLDKNLHSAVYCRSGRRSGLAIDMMKKKNINNISHLEGGILEWKANGNETVK